MIVILYGLFNPDQLPFPKCPFHSLTGLLCPGCGSQRAMYQLLHGHVGAAFKLNQLFLPSVFYALGGFVTANIFPASWPMVRQKFYGLNAAYISLVVILVFWILRNLF